jgi:hypothetical protein
MSATVPTTSAQVPTMSIKKIFRESRRPQATAKSYSIEDIRFHAGELRAKVYEKFKNLGSIFFPNYDLLVARWQKISIKDRQDTLKNAWGDIPQNHRPEAFDAVGPAKRVGKLCPDYYMIPFVNIQDLQHKDLLLMLLDARSRHPPHTFARTELLFAPYGKVDVQSLDRTPLLKMQIDNARQYGTVQTFSSEQKAMDFEDEGRGVRPVKGLQIIYLQDLLLGFLLTVTKLILHDKIESIDFDRRPAAPAPLRGLYDEEPSRLFEMAVMQPLRPREGLQLDRILSLVSAECLRAHDLVWDMREDPRHFEDRYCLIADHDMVQIPDVHGRVDLVTTKIEFVSYTLHMLVARSHYTLILWDQLQSHLKKVQMLFADSPGGVDLRTMTPIDLVEAIQQLHVLLARVRQMTVEELGWFTASPEFRSLYVRLSDTETETKIERSAEFTKKKNEKKADLCTILEQLREPHIFADDRYYLEVLETFLRVHSEKDLDRSAEGYISPTKGCISPPVTEAITKLWILAECAVELEKKPWDAKVASAIPQEEDKVTSFLEKLQGPTAAWEEIFTKAGSEGFVTNPQLGQPGPQFYYNVKATESREKNVNMLCKAEANLDAFWNHVDDDLKKLSSNWQQGVLQRLLDESGSMHRTIPWSERDHSKMVKSPPVQEIYDSKPQPLSHVFHDPSVEITGNFDKSSIVEKTKEKTRGVADHAEADAEPARELSPEPRLKFTLSENIYEVFRALFHLPGEKDQPPKLEWLPFVNALVHLGFTAEHMQGSQWQFNPLPRLNLTRGISFHQPHPRNEVPLEMARRFGRRLNRAYGWDGSMFKEEEKVV